ncbi:hypothetical protein A3G67_04705 [Candidatus Roizmanbacteria bacterium RIFCSPLOWO2_12_FULL_40_12]|uniref:Uncharacterized protein n=1 Tax=Candidatus Roizmanbacteria bacterium RIFCSPLOWO2_01_FULL_40_42 TaxID=1802066 RepID=A0A1F7J4N0_9BACT|nr:MAG: hypothetical protein A2779_04445 [Candidatus Roizmanbacteria bacterium RIFCSPHIGHO2_01_FULL_40_98]OGK27324.1 MAG: hypothetical protein A3C31_04770 [Candidatus Roizmanbacteria bacterium RIFCSPHIGHO2_02_FULL_40_53]OGK30804.1 MAG: hypothetical protein A2W49_02270 [Candidatus Roizmanbacteria bacterium RIFCSPHIGHO2_12_41_18]OGK36429.1 MAG: hypothetical protein A3E69_02395 [Candidatus Roizmanbacteria bacterium RIFCSPHIGHO2_12_FULL_40_130]OGK50557.1 MAG: hypothetical protein A3B50_02125 [Candi
MDYTGVIIEESLDDKEVLKHVRITNTNIEEATPKHRTPWINQWTLHTVEITEDKAKEIAEQLSRSLDKDHANAWYADFKNENYHYIIYRGKIFQIDLKNPVLYKEASKYGVSIGIPDYQVDFAPDDKVWER